MKTHYHTSEKKLLCGTRAKYWLKSSTRFGYKIGENGNCKKCDEILTKHCNQSESKCISFETLGYYTECQWRKESKCNCIDDCRFKV